MKSWMPLALALLPALLHTTPIVLDDAESADGWSAAREPASVSLETAAAVGQGALRVTMPGTVSRRLTRTYVPGSEAWDGYAGIALWVKGDGSDQFGCLAVEGTYSFVATFPLANRDWQRLVIPWREFVAENQADPIGAFGGMPPSGIQGLRFGSRWTIGHNNAPIPPHSFAVDQIELVQDAPPAEPVPAARPFADVLAQLRARQPVRIQCMGDSITAGTGLADRDRERYATQTQDLLRRWLGYADIHCASRAVGGAKLNDARAWVPRDFVGPKPDLVTIWYGYNDKSNAFTREYFARSLDDYIDRVLRATGGQAAILLFATGPGCGPRFTMLDDYAETVRETAARRGLPCFDIHAALKAVGRTQIDTLFADLAHPNAAGHARIADLLASYLVEAAGIDIPKPGPPPRPAAGPARRWDFEDAAEGWRLDGPGVTCAAGTAVSGQRALHFALPGEGADHRRAYSPLIPVAPRQLYAVSARLHAAGPLATGSMGLFACFHDNAAGEGEPRIVPIQRGFSGTGAWEARGGLLEIPDGVLGLRILIWASRDATGEFRCDDVTIEPAAAQQE